MDDPARDVLTKTDEAAALQDSVQPRLEIIPSQNALVESSVRIHPEILDQLTHFASELVLTRNQLLQLNHGNKTSAFDLALQRLSNVTQELQEHILAKIPLTLPLVSILILEVGGQKYGLSQAYISELVRSKKTIEYIHGTPVYRLRDQLLPLMSLRDRLSLPQKNHGDDLIIVMQVGAKQFGLLVDDMRDMEEILIKPMPLMLKGLPIFSGNTILNDGNVILILDPEVLAAPIADSKLSFDTPQNDNDLTDHRMDVLMFLAGDQNPKAVPLAMITRLEKISSSQIELANGRHVFQYQQKLMPLMWLDEPNLPTTPTTLPVLILSQDDQMMGLVVDKILDTANELVTTQMISDRPDIMGSTIIRGKATDIINASYFTTKIFGEARRKLSEHSHFSCKVLLVDDSAFFRNLLSPVLAMAGYQVKTARSGAEALLMAEKGEVFDAILSDLDMPEMSGFEFAKAVRAHALWKETPLIALSAQSNLAALDKDDLDGFHDYVSKTDRDALLETLAHILGLEDDAS